ncbi:MAG TPA: head GIN domain-containing protein [Anaerolineaceae bacterium]|nr:head GIN domain-containing protein [Anaerolineaceae bacterium]
MKRIIFVLLLAVAFTISGCGITVDLGNVVRGSGRMSSDTREVSGFTQVSILGSGDAQITKSDHESLKIEAEDNILPLITSEIQNGKLILGFKPNTSISTTLPIHFTITVKDLTGVEVNGSSNVSVGDIQTSSMALAIHGSGNINLASLQANSLSIVDTGSGDMYINSGKVDSQQISISGSGTYSAPNLESQTAAATVSGSGNVTVWAKGTLNAVISGSGSVSYFGSPQVVQNVSGSGSITSKGAK